ncbi:MAG: hypothetical protein GF364_22645 [Candidatus Lokiarchaeota archaeon]|nr:hypothetical protein [Candidatus Lokiarchaeota archaeon]
MTRCESPKLPIGSEWMKQPTLSSCPIAGGFLDWPPKRGNGKDLYESVAL